MERATSDAVDRESNSLWYKETKNRVVTRLLTLPKEKWFPGEEPARPARLESRKGGSQRNRTRLQSTIQARVRILGFIPGVKGNL